MTSLIKEIELKRSSEKKKMGHGLCCMLTFLVCGGCSFLKDLCLAGGICSNFKISFGGLRSSFMFTFGALFC